MDLANKVTISENSDDQDVFEIKDFTTASDWERFTAEIESGFKQFKLNTLPKVNPKAIQNIKWNHHTISVKLSEYTFLCTHYSMIFNKDDIEDVASSQNTSSLPDYANEFMESSYDFPEKCHCIARWYGLRQFIVIAPQSKLEPINSMSRGKFLLSALAMAANNAKCTVPLFVQLKEPMEKMFIGVASAEGIRTDFEMAHLKIVPSNFKTLHGFKQLINEHFSLDHIIDRTTRCTVRITYILSEWPYPEWTPSFPDVNHVSWNVDDHKLLELPFGAINDTTNKLQISCLWNIKELCYTESVLEAMLDPRKCNSWSLRLTPSSPPICLLQDYINTFLQVCQNPKSFVDILGLGFDNSIHEENLGTAFDRLTEDAVPTISSVVSKVRSKRIRSSDIAGPIPTAKMSVLLDLLFPNESSDYAYPETYSDIPSWEPHLSEMPSEHPLKSVLQKMKSCPVDSFLWRLTIIICHIMQADKSSVAHLLHKVKMELRDHWDNAEMIAGIPTGTPNLSMCLLHQKLQMLNICIKKRRCREGKDENETENYTEDENEDDEEDEFYECEEELDEGQYESECEVNDSIPAWDAPEGRMRKLQNLKLIKHSRFIYVPYTQEPTPLTEDRIEARTKELLGYGTDAKGNSMKTKLMATNLLSDMECFKAANPGAIFEDFVRWYSPRDWIHSEKDSNKYGRLGELSQRMGMPNNLWQELWNDAQPVPARRQRRLFDETREVQIIFDWLDWLTPGTFCKELFHILIHAVICRLVKEPLLYALPAVTTDADLPKPEHCNSLLSQLEMVSQKAARHSKQSDDLPSHKSFLNSLFTIESAIARASSLHKKLIGLSEISSASFATFDKLKDFKCETDRLELVIMELIRNGCIKYESSLTGLVADDVINLFSRGTKKYRENQDEFCEANLPSSIVSKDHLSIGARLLGREFAREFIFRTMSSNPEPWSREMPHRIFVVAMQNDYRMALTTSQDTVFC